MPYIEIDAQRYEFSELKKSNVGKHPALIFCYYWLNGQKDFLLQTSGSSGKPKIISVSRDQMMISASGTIKALGLTSEDKALVCLNTSYIGGMMMLVRSMVLGMDILVLPPEDNPLCHVPEGFEPTFTALVPIQASKALQSPQSKAVLANMNAVIVGGAAVDAILEEQFQEIEAPIFSTYGMTETVSHIALRRLNGEGRSSAYHLLENLEISQNEAKCLRVRGAVTKGRWLETNDIVTIEEDKQRFRWEGRADLTINSGGVKVQIVSIERVVHAWLAQERHSERVIALGVPDPDFGEKISLAIEAEAWPEWLEELKVVLERKLDKYQAPKGYFACIKFPVTPTGKIDRKALATLLN